MTKKELRKKYTSKRNELQQNELDAINNKILNIINEQYYKNKTISIFLPIQNKNEINTFQIIKSLETENRITSSVSNFTTFEMEHLVLDSNTELSYNNFQIPEPKSGQKILEKDIDIVFVPLLAIDKSGQRVGYGKGFYDRFLSKCSPHCIFIGLHLFDIFDKIDDISTDDIKLHYCITPHKIYKF
ncbi:MAG: 5-formyltetrahydrofolate cyclo-ligase [Flavobacteriia bacterium]|nr:5-formyltetrahydrofolate cyclo-ligase [Flavobacteriia bacterium]